MGLQRLENEIFSQLGITVQMLRLDAIRPLVNGNKLFKLKYNLLYAKAHGYIGILTFGGQYSNHIHAVAAAAREHNLKSIGIVVGNPNEITSTLQFAINCGMELCFINRESYRQKHTKEFLADLEKKYPGFYIIPEGGSNKLAVKGCAEIPALIEDDFDVVVTASGTGGTLAGIALGIKPQQRAIGISVLKGEDSLTPFIRQLHGDVELNNWEVITGYYYGGYAKKTKEVELYINSFYTNYGIELEHVYTAKMMLALEDLVQKEYFQKGSRIIAVHSGGLQK